MSSSLYPDGSQTSETQALHAHLTIKEGSTWCVVQYKHWRLPKSNSPGIGAEDKWRRQLSQNVRTRPVYLFPAVTTYLILSFFFLERNILICISQLLWKGKLTKLLGLPLEASTHSWQWWLRGTTCNNFFSLVKSITNSTCPIDIRYKLGHLKPPMAHVSLATFSLVQSLSHI